MTVGADAAPVRVAWRVRVTGIVQGVGFRPFLHRLASRHALDGWVRNVAGAVELHVEGDDDAVRAFVAAIRAEAPPLAQVGSVTAEAVASTGLTGFDIRPSEDAGGERPVPADVALCDACAAELADPADRRHRYPFITCTDCGPRYTVIEALPYDRERTTLRAFPLCPACAREYATPGDRRHHAESTACPACGPRCWFEGSDGVMLAEGDAAIAAAAAALREGAVVAIRGLGGFHLACDATDTRAVERLRDRKHRESKPLAVMVRTVEEACRVAHPSPAERAALRRPAREIVLMPRRPDGPLAPGVAPGLAQVGVMLAYTALHHLLLEACGVPLVMTSGNRSDEPIAIGNDEARRRLAGIADRFLLHDREVLSRCDDSVLRLAGDTPVLLRRGRGHAPTPLALPVPTPAPLVAAGPHLKNTFTLARGATAYVSPHIGDLEGLETLEHFREALARYRTLFRLEPEVAVRDLHPGYLSTRVAEELGLARTVVVQHHHAHVAAVAAEHGVTTPVVGLAFDGTGLGDDGAVWGAEVLVADLTGYRRAARLTYAPMPGGDLAARQPWRAALGYLHLRPEGANAFALALAHVGAAERRIAEQQVDRGINAPNASSMGRLFDAAAAVLGLRHYSDYEGQAAMELEAVAGGQAAPPLDLPVTVVEGVEVLDPLPLLIALGERRQRRADLGALAASFHESVAAAAAAAAARAAEGAGTHRVALGGGSWQNARLLTRTRERLEAFGLEVLVPRYLGPNDGAISYGQAAIAAAQLAAAG